jgi:hypothetical protein
MPGLFVSPAPGYPRLVLVGLLALLASAILIARIVPPALVLADEPARGQLVVPGDHHLPGATFTITGYDLDAGDTISFELVSGATSVSLGDTTVAADGTVSMPAAVPTTFPKGYAGVVGTGRGGTQLKTVVLIGERAEGPGAQLAADEWTPDRIAGVGMMGVGLAIVAAMVATHLRGRKSGGAAPS